MPRMLTVMLVAFGIGLAATPLVSAAPINGAVIGQAAIMATTTEQAGYHRRHCHKHYHCYWHHGHKICKWVCR